MKRSTIDRLSQLESGAKPAPEFLALYSDPKAPIEFAKMYEVKSHESSITTAFK